MSAVQQVIDELKTYVAHHPDSIVANRLMREAIEALEYQTLLLKFQNPIRDASE